MEIPIEHYFYIIIILFLLFMSFLVLKKSTSIVNIYFVFTPIIFSIMIFSVLMNNYLSIPAVITEILYIIAPLGILFSSWYIFHGNNLFKHYPNLIFLAVYLSYLVIMVAFINDELYKNLIFSFDHLIIVLPFSLAIINFIKLIKESPDQKGQIRFLIVGLLINIIGFIIRGVVQFLSNVESIEGLIITLIGIILVLFAFRSIDQTKH